MIVDSDDFVHREIVAFTGRHAGAPGWFISHGWRYSGTRNVYRSLRAFHLQCGSAYILPFSAYGVPDDASVDLDQAGVLDVFGDRLAAIVGSHMRVVQWCRKNGYPLRPLPFRGAMHHVDTGENHSGGTLGGVARVASREVHETYGLPIGVEAGSPRFAAVGVRRILVTPSAYLRSAYNYLQRRIDATVAGATPRFDMFGYRESRNHLMAP